MSASRRLASSSRSTPSRTAGLLAALDSLDLDATEVYGTKVNGMHTRIDTDEVEFIERKMNSIEGLRSEKQAGAPSVYSFLQRPAPQPSTSAAESATTSTRTGSRASRSRSRAAKDSPPIISIGAEEEKTAQEVLPIYSYRDYTPQPFIVYTRHEEETNDLIGGLKSGPVAIDLEWCVTYYRKAGSNSSVQNERKAAVIQIADGAGLIFVIQVNGMRRFPERLQALIENPKIPKVGVNILNDGKKLFRDYGIVAKNLVELGSVALIVDPSPISKRKIVSLAKLVEHYCGKTLSKGPVRTSNWEKPLTPSQKEYAANDAHASLMVYNELLKLGRIHSCSLDGASAQYTNEVTWSSRGSVTSSERSSAQIQEGMRPQYLRAYEYWHQKRLSLEDMCLKLSLKSKGYYGPVAEGDDVALKPGTVIGYVIAALQNDPKLEYKLDKLVELVQMDLNSWSRHREWIVQQS